MYTIDRWNVRTMNQGKLNVGRTKMSSLNIDILAISKLKQTGTGYFISEEQPILFFRQENHKRNGEAIIFNKSLCSDTTQTNDK